MTSGVSSSWVQQMGEIWVKGAPAAIVRLRMEWPRIDAGALQQAARWTEEGRLAGWQPGLFAATFENVLKLLAATAGDPPVPAALRQASRAILTGPADETLVGQTESLVRRLLPDLDERLTRVEHEQRTVIRRLLAMIAAGLALPRVEILRLAGVLSPASADTPDRFGDVLQAALDLGSSEPERREGLLVRALELAAPSSAPDNLFVLRTILQREDRALNPDTLRACVHRLSAMAAAGTGGDEVVWNLGIVAARVNAGALAPELFGALAEAGEALVGRDLSEEARLAAGVGAAEQWLRLGRLDRCDGVVWRLRQTIPSPASRLRTAVIEADVRALCSDLPGARAVLVQALDATRGAEVALGDRRKAVLHLIADWPVELIEPDGAPGNLGTIRPGPPEPGHSGIDHWIDEGERLIDASEEWARNSLRVQLLASLYQLGAYDRAAALRPSVDFELWRQGSADYKDWSGGIEEWVDRQAADAAGKPGAVGDAGKDYTTLGLEQRFPEAASLAESDAATSLARGFRIQAYGALVSAARFYRLARDREAALATYQRAFDLLENDLVYLPYAELVVSRLAAWPELYQLASVTALQLDDPVRAVSLAETGRSRATGSRLAVLRRHRPDQVDPTDWDEFCRLWRHAVADATNALVSDPGPVAGPTASPETDRINELRRRFVAAGVPVEELAPVGPPVDAASVLPRLALAGRPTVVLYTIRVAGTVRFVRLTADHVTEIQLERDAHERLVRAVDIYVESVHKAEHLDIEISQLLRGLLDEAGPVLEPILAQAIDGFAGGRLIWVPQGALVGFPLQAAPCGHGSLIDAVSVMVSSSLVSAVTAMEPDATPALRTAAIKGTHRGGQAATEGGAQLLTMPGHPPPDEVVPETLEQLNRALAGSSLVHLACHGHFRWNDPLSSTLQLGFDLSVGELFDRVDVAADSLVLLGTCDSGTIAQSDLNEGIGMPAGLIAAGARTVVGASWPVAAPSAVGVCRRFVEGLAAGLASPEALRQATLWLRDARLEDLQQELAAIAHPMAARIAAQPESVRHEKAFRDPARWASYLHWGGAWAGR